MHLLCIWCTVQYVQNLCIYLQCFAILFYCIAKYINAWICDKHRHMLCAHVFNCTFPSLHLPSSLMSPQGVLPTIFHAYRVMRGTAAHRSFQCIDHYIIKHEIVPLQWQNCLVEVVLWFSLSTQNFSNAPSTALPFWRFIAPNNEWSVSY